MTLRIFLLGQFRIQADDRPLDLPSRPAQSLLSYLVLHAGVNQRRERLAGLVWPDATESNARGYLRQALWRIRKALEDGGLDWQSFLEINDITITFDNRANYWLDIDALLAPADEASTTDLTTAAALYQGELLPGFYDEWLPPERDRIQAAYHHKMSRLISGLIQARCWDGVRHWAEEWIRLGHSPEPAFRALLEASAATGDRTLIQATYQRCIDALERDSGIEPSFETHDLYQRLSRTAAPEQVTSPPVATDPAHWRPAFLDQSQDPPFGRPAFVGRRAELAEMEHHLQQVLTGRGRVIFVTGEAGSGKTALLDAFTDQAQADNPALVIAGGNCNAHTGIGDPYLPFREILELLAGDVESRWAARSIGDEHARRLWLTLPMTLQAVIDAGPGLINTFLPGRALAERAEARVAAGTGWLVQLRNYVDQRTGLAVAASPQQGDLFRQYSRVLQQLARQVPLLLVLDDLQWADLGSISLLFHLGRQLAGHRILIVGAYRPEDVALGRDGDRHPLAPVVNELQRVSGVPAINVDQAASRHFVTALLDSEPNQLGPSFRQMLFQQTGGHPLFTVELLRGMQERGDLVHNQAGQWVEGPALDWEDMPARVEAVIAERVDRLAQPLQAALQVASIEGEQFSAGVIGRVLGVDESEMQQMLSSELDHRHRLVGSQSILRLNGRSLSRFRFRHILFQKYLYSKLDDLERIYLHERVGTAMEEIFRTPEEIRAVAPQMARHFQEAGITHKAVHYLHLAGEKAVQMSAYQEAIAHLVQALSLLTSLPHTPERDEQELALQLALGMAHMRQIPGDEWRTSYARARELCVQIGRTEQLCRIMGELSTAHFVRAEHEQARTLGSEALSLARQTGDPLLEALGGWYLGFVLFYLGEFEACRFNLAPMLALYDPQRHHQSLLALRGSDAGISALAYDGCALWCLGYPDQALQRSRRVLDLIRQFDHPFSVIEAICLSGCLFNALRQEAAELEHYAAEIVGLAREADLANWQATGIGFHGEALVLGGQAAKGLVLLHQGMIENGPLHQRLQLGRLLNALALGYEQVDRRDKARKALEDALAHVEESGGRYIEAEALRLRANLFRREGDGAAAESDLCRALDVAHRQKAKSFELRAAVDLARLWRDQGRAAEARALLTGTYGWFTEGFDTAELQEAHRLLGELS